MKRRKSKRTATERRYIPGGIKEETRGTNVKRKEAKQQRPRECKKLRVLSKKEEKSSRWEKQPERGNVECYLVRSKKRRTTRKDTIPRSKKATHSARYTTRQ